MAEEKDFNQVLEEAKEEYKKTLNEGYSDFIKEIAGYQLEYKPEHPYKELNKGWELEWKDFIKYDQDWDWSFFTNTIIYKLKKMRAWFSRFGMTEEKERTRIVAEIDEAIRLYNYAIDTDFDKEVMEWSKSHLYRWVEVELKHEYDGPIIPEPEMPEDGPANWFQKLRYFIWLKRTQRLYKKYNKKYILYKTKRYKEDPNDINTWSLFNSKEVDDWCKANGHKNYKDVSYLYCSKWDHEWNHWIWLHRLNKAHKKEQKAFDAFFLYISNHFRGWWD